MGDIAIVLVLLLACLVALLLVMLARREADAVRKQATADVATIKTEARALLSSASLGKNRAPAFPPDTLFVKEHLDGEGAVSGLTIMFRGPDGSAPDSADWWWGRTDAAGTLQDEGQVAFCIACHAGANAEAFVFGVEAGNQTAQ